MLAEERTWGSRSRWNICIYAVPAELFVRVWRTSKSVGQVCRKLGLPHTYTFAKARYIRKLGVPLRKFATSTGSPVKLTVAKSKKIVANLIGKKIVTNR